MNRIERGRQLQLQVEEAFLDLEHQLSLGLTEEFIELLEFYAKFRSYSPGNIALILMQNPEATRCAGFRQWEKLGYYVRRGEEAIWIRAPRMAKKPDPETGELVEVRVGWLAVPVFDVSQLDGDVELPQARHALEGDYDRLYLHTRVAMGVEGILVDEEPLPTDIHGMSFGGRVVISPALSDAEKCLALIHEWGHEILHKQEDRAELSKNQKELEAEAVSFVVARMFGLDNPFSRNYITMYRGTVEGLHDSMSRIHRAVGFIMSRIDSSEKALEVEAA